MEIIASVGPLGAEVRGIDMREPLSAAEVATIRQAWNDHLVLHEGPAAYSSLLFHADGDAACLYEGGTDDFRDGLIFQRFPLA